MIIAIGLDICELERIERLYTRHRERCLSRLLTPREQAALAGLREVTPRLAGRFAAKEAAMKALGTGWQEGVNFTDIEVVNATSGAPQLHLYRGAADRAAALGAARWHVSISHERTHAVAVVILEDGS